MSLTSGVRNICGFIAVGALSVSLSFGNDSLQERQEDAQSSGAEKWRRIVQIAATLPEFKRLTLVNDFINNESSVAESFCMNELGGEAPDAYHFSDVAPRDCKCYAKAKYIALQQVGVPEDKLRITYATASGLNRSHIVLTYFPDNESVPLVLDNLTSEIKKADLRTDLLPIYSFKGFGLWQQAETSLESDDDFAVRG